MRSSAGRTSMRMCGPNSRIGPGSRNRQPVLSRGSWSRPTKAKSARSLRRPNSSEDELPRSCGVETPTGQACYRDRPDQAHRLVLRGGPTTHVGGPTHGRLVRRSGRPALRPLAALALALPARTVSACWRCLGDQWILVRDPPGDIASGRRCRWPCPSAVPEPRAPVGRGARFSLDPSLVGVRWCEGWAGAADPLVCPAFPLESSVGPARRVDGSGVRGWSGRGCEHAVPPGGPVLGPGPVRG